ncbi:MAG: glycoside hydrolase family 97 catalytic domain-containing protein [Cyclobacteriaceae bacterium]
MRTRNIQITVKALGILSLVTLLHSCRQKESTFTVKSPNDELSVVLDSKQGKIMYSISSMGKTLVGTSEISIFPGKLAKITAVQKRSHNSTWKPTWGQFSEIQDNYNGLALEVEYDQIKTKLCVRLFDQGVGFRYEIEDYKEEDQATFLCQYNLTQEHAVFSPSGESEPLGPIAVGALGSLDEKSKLKIPIVVEKPGSPYLSLIESDLFSAEGFKVMNIQYDDSIKSLVSSNKVELTGGKLVTPWRVILVNDKLGDLVVNTVPMNLAAPLQIENPSWIRPGKTLWDWRVHGYKAEDGFTYGINTESYKRFIDFAAETGIEYFLIDDAWYTHVSPGHFELSDKLDLEAVINYAAEKEVDLLLYYDRRHGEYGDDKLFPYYKSLGMKGIKYGFMSSNVPFTRQAVQQSAVSQLLIDFHDGPVPMTGIERTMPNAITKEYCHAQQDSRRAFTPETFIKMALINAIQGPLDMNNGNFDLTGINRGDREKGPRKTNSYVSTVVSEAARTLIIYSGLVCIPDAPEAYSEKADLFEFIQKLPVGKWDESRVLRAKMGEYITTARRYRDEWFIGSVHDQQGGTLDIALDFLKPGREYQVTYYEDTEDTHGTTNPEAYQVRTGTIQKGDIVKAKIAPGGGHCMWIR